VEFDDRLLDQAVRVDARAGVLVEAAVEDLEEFLSVVVGDVLELAVHDALHDGLDVFALEGSAEGAEFLKDDAQRPHVALQALLFALADLGAELVRGPHCGHRHVRSGVQTLGDAEVAQLHGAVLVHEHIRTLEVTVEDLVAVQLPDCLDQLHEVVPDFGLSKELVAGLAFLDEVAKVSPICLLHEYELVVLQLVGALLVDDVHVREALQDFDLLEHHLLYFGVLDLDGLQGEVGIVVFFPDEVDFSLAAFTDLFLKFLVSFDC